MSPEAEFHERMQKIERLVADVQATADPQTRAKAGELVEILLQLHGAGLGRMFDIVSAAESPGSAAACGPIVERFVADSLVSSLLLLYNLHPVDFETRVARALDKVRPYLKSHGGDVELLAVHEGSIRLRLVGSCHGCPSSAQTLKSAIEKGIYEAAPNTVELFVEGVVEEPRPVSGFVPLGQLQSAAGHA